MPSSHQAKIGAIAAQMAARPRGARVTIRKITPSHSVRDGAYKADCHPVNVSPLNEILAIDTDARLGTAEGQVLIGDRRKYIRRTAAFEARRVKTT